MCSISPSTYKILSAFQSRALSRRLFYFILATRTHILRVSRNLITRKRGAGRAFDPRPNRIAAIARARARARGDTVP